MQLYLEKTMEQRLGGGSEEVGKNQEVRFAAAAFLPVFALVCLVAMRPVCVDNYLLCSCGFSLPGVLTLPERWQQQACSWVLESGVWMVIGDRFEGGFLFGWLVLKLWELRILKCLLILESWYMSCSFFLAGISCYWIKEAFLVP